MAVPKSTLWDMDQHTEAKHDLLGGYLDAWFPIIASKFPSLTYAEGFAGPNEYSGGEPGSPSIALARACRDDVVATSAATRFVFVEERADRHKHLEMTLARDFPLEGRLASLDMTAHRGTCQDDLLPCLGAAGAWGKPVFANLDGWGADVPYEVVRRIGVNGSSEVLITVTPSHFMRFADVVETKAGDRVFGHTKWRTVAECESPADKRRFLVDTYRASLASAGFPFSLLFEMLDEGGHELYLFYGTSHWLGLDKMKDAMWKVDPVHGQRFRDPRDPDQFSFTLDEPQLVPLQNDLVELMRTKGPLPLEVLRQHARFQTIYRIPHANRAVRTLRDSGRIKTPMGHLKDESIIELG
jgi:three-Cys-motif partner protein